MKKPQLLFLFTLILLSNVSFSQKLYDDKNPLALTKGHSLRLTSSTNPQFPADLLSFELKDTSNYELKANIYADYRHWKFTNKLLLGAYGKAALEYSLTRHDQPSPFDPSVTLNKARTTVLTAQLYGAASYYLQPNKFYGTGALGIGYANSSSHYQSATDVKSDSSVIPSYLWGALGYGRINNRQVVEVSYDFDEALRKTGIIDSPLDDNTLLKLSEMLYRQRDGEYRDKYEDDEMIELFNDIERTLLDAGYIDGSLNAASTVRLYEILNNTSKKYVFYPKYSGYQVQGQVQYQIANEFKDKPHNHYLSLSGVYCWNLSKRTNMVFSGFYAIPLDSMATDDGPVAGFANAFQNYLAFLPDRNNLDFFSPFPPFTGTGSYGGTYVQGLGTVIGVRADVFHSLSSVTGIQGTVALTNQKYKYKNSFFQYQIAGRFDYNIYSKLGAYVKMELIREANLFGQFPLKFTTSIGMNFRVF